MRHTLLLLAVISSSACAGGTCMVVGERSCDGNSVRQCELWEHPYAEWSYEECGDKTCMEGNGTAQCVSPEFGTCKAIYTASCSADARNVLSCMDNGYYVVTEECASNEICAEDRGVGRCTPSP